MGMSVFLLPIFHLLPSLCKGPLCLSMQTGFAYLLTDVNYPPTAERAWLLGSERLPSGP